ncbi:MAG: dTDP-glucose 4,6-dehydratase [Thermoanaerobaculia bacterium]|nr:dTDP-glucose 4,6-dehydratase [Thermoanaerobaculia bacterium]
MPNLLVTGGAGFIGSNFVRLTLAETEHRIVVLDRLTYAGHRINLAEVEDHPRLVFHQGDIADRETVRRLYREYEPLAVVNFAAESHVDRSIDGPDEFVRTNIVGTFELLEAARRSLAARPRDGFRMLQVSTDEDYGSLGKEGRFEETTPYAPNSPYAASKAAADHLVRAYNRTYSLPTLTTNCSNNYGPFQYPEKLVPLMILNAVEGRSLPIYGDGSNVRDWLFVEDHCRGLLAALERGTPGETYNFGGEAERTNLEVVQTLCGILEEIHPPTDNEAAAEAGYESYDEMIEFVTDRPGHDRRYAMEISKVERELGWSPTVSFEKGLRRTVEWYLENLAWCRAVQQDSYDRRRLGLDGAASGGEEA